MRVPKSGGVRRCSGAFGLQSARPLHVANRQLSFRMPTELPLVDAEDLKSRARELRRFL